MLERLMGLTPIVMCLADPATWIQKAKPQFFQYTVCPHYCRVLYMMCASGCESKVFVLQDKFFSDCCSQNLLLVCKFYTETHSL